MIVCDRMVNNIKNSTSWATVARSKPNSTTQMGGARQKEGIKKMIDSHNLVSFLIKKNQCQLEIMTPALMKENQMYMWVVEIALVLHIQ